MFSDDKQICAYKMFIHAFVMDSSIKIMDVKKEYVIIGILNVTLLIKYK